MKPAASDLRYLKLAELYEQAFERSILDVASKTTKDERVSAALTRLAPESSDLGTRISQEMARLNASLGADDERARLRAAVLDVIDVERAARRFYVETVDRVHDPIVVRLFRELAKEEDKHVRVTEDILAMIGGIEIPAEPAPISPADDGVLGLDSLLSQGRGRPPRGRDPAAP